MIEGDIKVFSLVRVDLVLVSWVLVLACSASVRRSNSGSSSCRALFKVVTLSIRNN